MFGVNSTRFTHLYLCFIPIIWIALRHGIGRVVTGVLVLNFGIVLAIHLFPPATIVNTKVGFFMLVISVTGLIVGSEVSERERTAIDLHKQTDYLNCLIENSPLGILVLDQRGRVELANTAFEKLSLYEQRELRSADIYPLLSSNAFPNKEELDIIPRVFAGEAVRVTVPWRRKDGKVIQVRINAVPLVLNGRVQGAYEICQDVSEYVEAREAREKHAESLNLLVKKLERRTAEMALLNEMRDWLECCEETEVGLIANESVPKLFPECLSGTMYLFKSTRELAEAEICWGQAGTSEPMFAPKNCWSLRRGRAHWSKPGIAGIRCSHLVPTNSASLCVPMIAQGTTQGVLHLEFPCDAESQCESDTERLQDSRRRLAICVAGHIATSLGNLRLRETLREQSVRDPLTDLFNRRFMEESLKTELPRAKRNEKPVSILLLDLDHFKTFNDIFGHDAGRFCASLRRRCLSSILPRRGYMLPVWRRRVCHHLAGVLFALLSGSGQCPPIGAEATDVTLQGPIARFGHSLRRRCYVP
jgi:PAS domain S-box-containing protein